MKLNSLIFNTQLGPFTASKIISFIHLFNGILWYFNLMTFYKLICGQ